MGLVGKVRRLYRLAKIEDRVAELEGALQRQRRELDQVKTSLEQADMLKSSLEVPREMVDDFFAWRAATPVPEQPLVSICVATYNRGRLLTERCIPSLLNQTYKNVEVVVVGDHCTDDTEARVSQIKDTRLKFLNLPERGNYPSDPHRRWMVAGTAAINKAMELATGDFISHLDDDDEHLPERVEKLLQFAKEQQCDFVWHPFWFEDGAGNWQLNHAPQFGISQVTTSSVFYRSWFKRITWNVEAHRLLEPGDWNRFRRIKYIGPAAARYPEPLLRHYLERQQVAKPK